MSERQGPKNPFPIPSDPITIDKLREAFEAAGAWHACPRCGSDNWAIAPHNNNSSAISMPFIDLKTQTPELILAVLSLICKTCGYCEIYDFAILQEYLKKSAVEKPLSDAS